MKAFKTKELKKFFEDKEFGVYLTKQYGVQCAELESWTNGGVDMIIWLNPFTAEEFKSYVDDFDIDETVDMYREGKDYKNAFTVRQSVEDFENYLEKLEEIVIQLENLK